jgi:hypothetical protein
LKALIFKENYLITKLNSSTRPLPPGLGVNAVASTLFFKSHAALPLNRAGQTEQRFVSTHTASFDTGEETGLRMAENKPKIERKPRF